MAVDESSNRRRIARILEIDESKLPTGMFHIDKWVPSTKRKAKLIPKNIVSAATKLIKERYGNVGDFDRTIAEMLVSPTLAGYEDMMVNGMPHIDYVGGKRVVSKMKPVCHVSPEAAARGPIAVLRQGDMIEINLEKNSLQVQLSDEEIQTRLDQLPAFESKSESAWLRRYSRFVTSADRGAVLI